uniref:50S ribosomal protein L33, chloroplastic n=1 Tax=Goodyera procera TaxID=798536 RepID=A0A109YTB8_9ASPA|nr:ribosomal protein L33 [Goodyera procera]AMA07056.1 ribosomal protein L33 [Goodyera procera]
MAKGKDIRILVILECTCCVRKGVNKKSPGISRYITQKNRHKSIRIEKIFSLCKKYTTPGRKEKK